MRQGRIGVGRSPAAQLDRMLEVARGSSLTYDHVGSTMPTVDARRRVRQQHLVLGHGPQAFERAVLGLRLWSCHQGIRALVHPGDAPIEAGSSLLVVVDEPGRFGFAYGTLDGHHERGEESFLAELLDDGTVIGTISVDAVAASLPARIVGPAVAMFQRLAVARYLCAWRSFVTQADR